MYLPSFCWYQYILYSIIRFHGYTTLFYNVEILKIIDTRNLSLFLILSFCFFTFHFFYLFWGTIIYYFFLSFYLLVSTFFLSFFNLFVVATIILLLLRFMVTFLFSMMWGGFKVRELIIWANAKGVLRFYGQLVM